MPGEPIYHPFVCVSGLNVRWPHGRGNASISLLDFNAGCDMSSRTGVQFQGLLHMLLPSAEDPDIANDRWAVMPLELGTCQTFF